MVRDTLIRHFPTTSARSVSILRRRHFIRRNLLRGSLALTLVSIFTLSTISQSDADGNGNEILNFWNVRFYTISAAVFRGELKMRFSVIRIIYYYFESFTMVWPRTFTREQDFAKFLKVGPISDEIGMCLPVLGLYLWNCFEIRIPGKIVEAIPCMHYVPALESSRKIKSKKSC